MASYQLTVKVAKSQKPHTTAEERTKPCILEIAVIRIILGFACLFIEKDELDFTNDL